MPDRSVQISQNSKRTAGTMKAYGILGRCHSVLELGPLKAACM